MISFNLCLSALRGRWRDSFELLRHMAVEALEPDAATASTALGAATKASQWPLGIEALAALQARQVRLDIVVWNVVPGRSSSKTHSIHSICSMTRLLPPNKIYNDIMIYK